MSDVTEEKFIGVVNLDVKAPSDGDGPGTFEAVLSTPTLDRDYEIIDPGAFDPLPDRLNIDADHGMSTRATVGSGRPFYDGDDLKIEGEFSSLPRAQEVRTLVTEGHIKSMSVAFMNAARHDDDEGRTHILKAELLNASFVAIPSNREASVLAAKAALKVGARNSAEDQERVQSLHDLSCDLGAACAKTASRSDDKTSQDPSDDADPEKAAAPAAASPADALLKTQLALAHARAHLATSTLRSTP